MIKEIGVSNKKKLEKLEHTSNVSSITYQPKKKDKSPTYNSSPQKLETTD